MSDGASNSAMLASHPIQRAIAQQPKHQKLHQLFQFEQVSSNDTFIMTS
jgi:hypothetical protein